MSNRNSDPGPPKSVARPSALPRAPSIPKPGTPRTVRPTAPPAAPVVANEKRSSNKPDPRARAARKRNDSITEEVSASEVEIIEAELAPLASSPSSKSMRLQPERWPLPDVARSEARSAARRESMALYSEEVPTDIRKIALATAAKRVDEPFDGSNAAPAGSHVDQTLAELEKSYPRLTQALDRARNLFERAELWLHRESDTDGSSKLRGAKQGDGDLRGAREKRARALLEEAVHLLPDHLPSLRALRLLRTAAGDSRRSFELLELELKQVSDPAMRAVLWLEKSRLLARNLSDAHDAKQAVRTAWEIPQAGLELFPWVRHLTWGAGDFAWMSQALERALGLAESGPYFETLALERARLELRLRHSHVAEQLFERIAGSQAPSAPAKESVVESTFVAFLAREALLRVYGNERRWNDWSRVAIRHWTREDAPSSPSLRIFSDVLDAMRRVGDARAAWTQASKLVDVANVPSWFAHELCDLALSAGDFAAADAAVSVAHAQESGSIRAETALQHAEMVLAHDNSETNRAKAEALLTAAMEDDPSSILVVRRAVQLARERGDLRTEFSLLQREADRAADGPMREALYFRIALLAEKYDPLLAAQNLQAVLALSPGNYIAFALLRDLWLRHPNYAAVVKLCQEFAEATPVLWLAHSVRVFAAEILFHRLDDGARALELYPKLAAPQEADLDALLRAALRAPNAGEALQALRSMAERERVHTKFAAEVWTLAGVLAAGPLALAPLDAVAQASDCFRRALALDATQRIAMRELRFLWEREGRFDELLPVMDLEADAAQHGLYKADVFLRMSQLAEQRNQDAVARKYAESALDSYPGHRAAISALLRIAERLGDRTRMLALWELLIVATPDPLAKSRVHVRLARAWEHEHQDETKAAEHYERAYNLDADNEAALRAALRCWTRAAQAKRVDALLEQTQGKLRALSEGTGSAWSREVLCAWLLWQSEVRELDMGDPRRAALCLSACREVETNLTTLTLCEASVLAARDPLELSGFYDQLQTQTLGKRVQAGYLSLLATLALEPTPAVNADEKLESAVAYASRAVQFAPDALMPLSVMEAASHRAEDYAVLARARRDLASRAENAELTAAYQTHYADYLEQQNASSCLDAYRAALVIVPGSERAALGFERTAAVFGQNRDRSEALVQRAWNAREPREKSDLLARAAKILTLDGALKEAHARLQEALTAYPTLSVAVEYIRLSGELMFDCRAVLSEAGQRSKDARDALGLWHLLADVNVERGDPAGVGAALLRALRVAPNDMSVLSRLAAHQESSEAWSDAVQSLAKLAHLTSDPEALLALQLKMAAILSEQIGDKPRAILAVQNALSLRKDSPAALRWLAKLSREKGDIERAESALRALLSQPQVEDRATLIEELAQLLQVRNRSEADAMRLASVTDFGVRSPSMPMLLRMHPLPRPFAMRLIDALEKFAAKTNDSELQYEAVLAQASIFRDELRDYNEAIRRLEALLGKGALRAEAQRELARLYVRTGNVPFALSHYDTLLEANPADSLAYVELADALPESLRRAAIAKSVAHALPERELASALPSRAFRTQPRTLDLGAFATELVPESYARAFRDSLGIRALALVREAIPKMFPERLEEHGLSAKQRLSARSEQPIYTTAEQICAVLGVAEPWIFLNPHRQRGVVLTTSDPGCVLVPSWALEAGIAPLRYLTARALVFVHYGVEVLHSMSLHESILLARAALEVGGVTLPSMGPEQAEIERYAAQFSKHLGRRARRALEELAGPYESRTRGLQSTLEAEFTGLRILADRVGVLVADDPVFALRATHGACFVHTAPLASKPGGWSMDELRLFAFTVSASGSAFSARLF